MKTINRILLVAILLFPAAASAIPLNPVDSFQPGNLVEFETMETLDGGKFNFEDYRGKKILILAFWLQTCDTCFEQLGQVKKFLAEDNRNKDIEVITVTRGKSGIERDFVKSMVERRGLDYTVVLDPEIYLARHFGTTELPAYVLIDKDGRMAAPLEHDPLRKIRDYSLLELADFLRKGGTVPPTQFVPYPRDAELRDMIGKPAPTFDLASTADKGYALPEYKGRMGVVLVFWHPYCSYCWGMMRKMVTYYDENRIKYNFVMLSLASLYGFAQEDEADRFIEETGAQFPILIDKESKVGEQYHIKKLPQVVIIDKEGKIVHIAPGETANLETNFTPFLEEIAK